MDGNCNKPVQTVRKRNMVDVPALIVFTIFMTLYVGVSLYALQNGKLAEGFVYIHNMIYRAVDIDLKAIEAAQVLDEINQARLIILAFIVLAMILSFLTVIIVQKATRFVLYSGIICELALLTALFVSTILASQRQIYKHSSSKPYLFFPFFIAFGFLKLYALNNIGLQFLSNLIRESCRVIMRYWLGSLMMFLMHMFALSTVLFGCYVSCQLMSISLVPLYDEVETEEGPSLEISNFALVSVPLYIVVFHTINILGSFWLCHIFWYLGYEFLSGSFAALYQNSEQEYNCIRTITNKLKMILRYHCGTIIFAASPAALPIRVALMWKYIFDNANECLKERPFIGSVSWLISVWNSSEFAIIFCSIYRTAFKESVDLVGKIFSKSPIQLLTIYAVLGWIAIFLSTLMTLMTVIVFQIYMALTNELLWTSYATIIIGVGAIAITAAVCQLFRAAMLSIHVTMIQSIQHISVIENKKPVSPAIGRIISEFNN